MLPTEETGYFVPEGVNYNPVTHKLSKLYNREEVDNLIIEGIKDFCEMNPLLRGCQVTDLEIEEWRKENL